MTLLLARNSAVIQSDHYLNSPLKTVTQIILTILLVPEVPKVINFLPL